MVSQDFDNNVVGQFIDKFTGDPKRGKRRKLLERLRVDDVLLRIAQTKGADLEQRDGLIPRSFT